MIGRIVFLSAAAFLAYKYIRRSNDKAQRDIAEAPGTVQILPPETAKSVSTSAATESLRPAKTARRLSAAAEDLSGK